MEGFIIVLLIYLFLNSLNKPSKSSSGKCGAATILRQKKQRRRR